MGARFYDFTTGYDQVTAPSGSTPSGVDDLATVGYGVSHYAIFAADPTAVKAISASFRTDGKPVFVKSLLEWFYFDSGSSATGDDVNVITPTAGTGRWLRRDQESTFAIANNQGSAQNITGLIASSSYRLTRIKYWVRRIATDTVMEAGELMVMFDGTNYYLGRASVETATTAGMNFDVNISTGQVTYTSSNMSGSYDTTNSLIGYKVSYQGAV